MPCPARPSAPIAAADARSRARYHVFPSRFFALLCSVLRLAVDKVSLPTPGLLPGALIWAQATMSPTFRATTASAARTFTLLSLLTAMVHASAPAAPLQKRAVTYEGCYSSSTPLDISAQGTYEYQSSGNCGTQCKGSAVYAMTEGDSCWCGDQLPALSDKVQKSDCDMTCTGYPSDICGGSGLWSVYTTESGVENYGGSDDSSSSSSSTKGSTSATPSKSTDSVVVTSTESAGQTVVVTVPASVDATPTSDANSSSGGGGGSNTAGIAAGVVVGVVAIAAIIGGVYFFLRRRKRIAAEEDFKQRTQVSDFMRGGDERKPPNTGYSGMSDQRLDPEAGRRDSVGSLADNQDYSRRILRVANPSD